MKDVCFCVAENALIAKDVYKMRLTGDTSDITQPGQFVNFKLQGLYLRRPISVCDVECGSLTVIYKVVGTGTAQLSQTQPGARLYALTGLGNGYDLSCAGDKPLLLGGGVGVPPLYLLAKQLISMGKTVQVVLGFNRADEVFYADEFRALGCRVSIATADGSIGVKGFVTDALPSEYSYFYTCGPEPMLKAVARKTVTGGQMSFEARMGCGFGACMGCSCETLAGSKRICKDGPVMRKEEIKWGD